jgi:pyridoxine kinase
MFAALTIARLREAVAHAGLAMTKSWVSPDDVDAVHLPLAKATEKVVSSMQEVLEKTKAERDREIATFDAGDEKDSEKRLYLRATKAAEVRLVRNVQALKAPTRIFKAVGMEI